MNVINPLLTIRTLLPAANTLAAPEQRQHGLQAGQIVHAAVAEGGQSSVLLDLHQQRFQAGTEIPLHTGQQLRLLIEETSPQLKLRLIKDSVTERLSHGVHLLEEGWDLASLATRLMETGDSRSGILEGLLSFFGGFGPVIDKAPSGKKLRELVSKLGLTLEAELARGEEQVESDNLKSALLSARKQLPEQNSELSDTLGRLLQKLEFFQLCNLRLAEQGAALVPLPLPFLERGFLIIEDGGKEKSTGNGHCKLSLFLTLKNLGDLRIDLLHEGGGLFLRFTCSSPQLADYMAGTEGELRSMLTGLPLNGVSYGCGVGNFATDLIRRILSEEQGLLNTRV